MKGLYKKVFGILGAIVILVCPLLTNAKDNVDTNRELKIMAIEKYDTENNVIGQMPYVINRLIVTKDEITIQYSGESEFVDVIGIDTDGKTYFLSEYAVWDSSDCDVVYADRGRILAENVGNAVVTVSYGEYKQQIQVSVKKCINYEAILASKFDLQNMTNEQRLRYVQNANSNVSSENYCLMYEQTPGRAQTTKWTYSSLAAGGYMPFSK